MIIPPLFSKYFYKHFPHAPKNLTPENWARIFRIAQELTGKRSSGLIWKKLEENAFLLEYFHKILEHTCKSFVHKKITVTAALPLLLILVFLLAVKSYDQHFPPWFLKILSLLLGAFTTFLQKKQR